MSIPVANSARGQSWFDRTWKWWVLGMIFLAMLLSALDRQVLAITMTPIAAEFGLDNAQRGKLLAAFMFTLAFSQPIVGFMIDRIRAIRLLMPMMVASWSVANMAVCLARDATAILGLRYLLGFAEAGIFPVGLLIVSRIFPPRERAFASGVFNSGTLVATLIAPTLVIWLSNTFGWRWSFLITGAFGLVWFIPWLLVFRRPEERAPGWPRAAEARQPLAADLPFAFKDVLRLPAFWGVALVGVGIVPGWYFLLNWLPSYLEQAWRLSYDKSVGTSLSFIYAAQDLGLWTGGAAAWWLARRGLSVFNARRTVLLVGFVFMLTLLALPFVNSVGLAVVCLTLCALGLSSWMANMQAFKQEVLPRRVALVVALAGLCETGFAAYVVQNVGGRVQAAGGFNGVFIMLGGFFIGAMLVVALLFRPGRFHLEAQPRVPAHH